MNHCPNLHKPLRPDQVDRLNKPGPGEYRIVEDDYGRLAVELADRTLTGAIEVYEWAIDTYTVDGRDLTAWAARQLRTSTRSSNPTNPTNPGDNNMNHTPDDRPSIRDQWGADDATGWLEKHDPDRAPVAQWIGSKATTMREAKKVADLWTALLRDQTLGYVTLDTDPEMPGRPRSMRPGVPAVIYVELPNWWPGTPGEVAAVYYWPSSTWLTDPDPVTEVRTELAGYRAGAGARAILYTFRPSSYDEVERRIEEGRRAVAAVAIGNAPEDDPETIEEERLEQQRRKFREIARM